MIDRSKFENMVALGRQTARVLIELGADEDFAREIERQIERKAGSLLPPIKGVLNVELLSTKVG